MKALVLALQIAQVEKFHGWSEGAVVFRLRRGLPRTVPISTRPLVPCLAELGRRPSAVEQSLLVRSGSAPFTCALGPCRLLPGEELSSRKDLEATRVPGCPRFPSASLPEMVSRRALHPVDVLFKGGTRPPFAPCNTTRPEQSVFSQPLHPKGIHPSHPPSLPSFILKSPINQTRQTHTHLPNAASRTRPIPPSLTIRRAHRRAAARPEHGTAHPVSIQRRAVTKCRLSLDSPPIRQRRGACRYRPSSCKFTDVPLCWRYNISGSEGCDAREKEKE